MDAESVQLPWKVQERSRVAVTFRLPKVLVSSQGHKGFNKGFKAVLEQVRTKDEAHRTCFLSLPKANGFPDQVVLHPLSRGLVTLNWRTLLLDSPRNTPQIKRGVQE